MSYIERYRIPCPSCGATISLDYNRCPKCCARVKTARKNRWWVWLTLVILLCAIALVSAAYIYSFGGVSIVFPGLKNPLANHRIFSFPKENEPLLFIPDSDPEPRAPAGNGAPQPEPVDHPGEEEGEFEAIFSDFSQRMREATPELINDMTDKARSEDAGFSASAEICAEEIRKLSEISGAGTEKMSELIRKATREKYELYSLWSSRLNEVYKEESKKIMDAYTMLISDPENHNI